MKPTSNQPSPRRWRRALPADEAGAAIFEMAMIVGLFLLIVFGIIEFSWMFAERSELQHVAGEGARRAAVGENPHDAICDSLVVAEGANYTMTVGGALDQGYSATITVSKPYDGITGMFPLTGGSLSAQHEFFIEADAPGWTPC